MEHETPRIIKAYKLLKTKYDHMEYLVVYGELFGGLYSHQNEKYAANSETSHVQKGVHYSPNLHFYAFDIRINSKTSDQKQENEGIKSGMLKFDEALNVFKQCGFLYAVPLMNGTFKECLAFDVDAFKSTIPSRLGLPEPTDKTSGTYLENIAEGIVLRKMNGTTRIKIKSSKFYEITGFKNKGAIKQKKAKAVRESLDGVGIREKAQKCDCIDMELFDFMDRCINENRFEAVSSKIGPLSMQNFRKTVGMMVGDVLKELNKQRSDKMAKIKKNEQKLIKKYASAIVNEVFAPKYYALESMQ